MITNSPKSQRDKWRKPLPPLDYLLAFEVTAQTGSFAAAAKQMRISETAIARKVKLLEDHFGLSFFDRKHRSITLSAQGTAFLSRISPALDMLRARWDSIGWWHDHTKEGNQIMAEKLRWPIEDVESVIGTNGKYLTGGIYMYDFDEAARACGVLEGDAPFGLGHGIMGQVTKTINEWWVRLGLMKTVNDPSAGIDCSLLGDLVSAGYRQSLTENK